MTIDIALRPFEHGDRKFTYASKVPTQRFLKDGSWTERQEKAFRDQRIITTLTRESFAMASARLAPGEEPQGFEKMELVALGIIDMPPEEAAAAPKPKIIDHVELKDDAIPVNGYFLQPVLSGRFTYFSPVTAQGRLLRASNFRKQVDGEAFLQALPAGSTEEPAAATPEVTAEDAESEDGGDLQSGPDVEQG